MSFDKDAKSLFNNPIVKFFVYYWIVIWVAVQAMRWVDNNSHYIWMLIIFSTLGLAGSLLIKYLRRW